MRHALTNNPLHNPFNNRFKVPVTRRDDEMQADGYTTWLLEKNPGHQGLDRGFRPASEQTVRVSEAMGMSHSLKASAGILAVLLLLLVALLLRAL